VAGSIQCASICETQYFHGVCTHVYFKRMNAQSKQVSSALTRSGTLRCAAKLLVAAALLAGPSLQAQVSRAWSPTPTDGDWNDTSNWTGGVVPVTGDRVSFGTSTTTTLNNDLSGVKLNAISSTATDSALLFQSGASSYTIGGNTLTLANDTLAGGPVVIRNDSVNIQTFNLNLTMSSSAGQTSDTATSGDLVFNGNITAGSLSGLSFYMGSTTSRTITFNGVVTLASSTTKGLGLGSSLSNTGGVYTFNNAINVTKTGTATLPVSVNSGTVNLNAATSLVTATGARTLTLVGGNTPTSATGTLNINNAGAFEEFTQINILRQGTTDTGGTTGTVSMLIGADTWSSNAAISIGTNTNAGASIVLGGKTGLGANGTATFGGDITALDSTNDRARTLTLTAAEGRVNFNGVISTASGGATVLGVTKTGAGVVSLGGANTYTGATLVSAGTLLVNGSVGASSAVTAASGATLGGTGTINGNTTISSGAILAPGESPGILTFNGTLTLNGTTNFELNGLTRGSLYDGVNTGAGLFTLGGALNLNFGAATSNLAVYDLFNIGAGGSTGSFTSVVLAGTYSGSLTNNLGTWTGTSGGYNFSFVEATGDLSIAAVPEPSTYLLLGLGLGSLWMLRRKQRI